MLECSCWYDPSGRRVYKPTCWILDHAVHAVRDKRAEQHEALVEAFVELRALRLKWRQGSAA